MGIEELLTAVKHQNNMQLVVIQHMEKIRIKDIFLAF